MADSIVKAPPSGVSQKVTSTGDMEVTMARASGAEALAAREEASVKARVALALRNPRDWMNVRSRMLRDCERPGFAQKAMYALPRGGNTIEGLTVRAAETLARHMGNIEVKTITVAEDERLRLCEVTVTDLESNFTETQQVTVIKTVERKANRDGSMPKGLTPAMVLGERLNSFGDRVFIVAATDDETNIKQNALVSKVRRNKILEMVPADVKEDVVRAIRETAKKASAADYEERDAWVKRTFDAFAQLRIEPSTLRSYCKARFQQDVEGLRKDDLAAVRALYAAIESGETTMARELAEVQAELVDDGEVVDQRTGEVIKKPAAPAAKPKEVVVNAPAPAPVASPGDTPVVAGPGPAPSSPSAAAQQPKADAPAASGAPPTGTDAYADWLAEQIRSFPREANGTLDAIGLKKLSSFINHAPAARRTELTTLYAQKRTGVLK